MTANARYKLSTHVLIAMYFLCNDNILLFCFRIQKPIALAAKIKIFESKVKQCQQNGLFKNQQKTFFKEIQSKQIGECEIPNDAKPKSFRIRIWEQVTERVKVAT